MLDAHAEFVQTLESNAWKANLTAVPFSEGESELVLLEDDVESVVLVLEVSVLILDDVLVEGVLVEVAPG